MGNWRGILCKTLFILSMGLGVTTWLLGCEPIDVTVAEHIKNCGNLEECIFDPGDQGDELGCNGADAKDIQHHDGGVFTCCTTGAPLYMRCEVEAEHRGKLVDGIGQSRAPIWRFEDKEHDNSPMFSSWVIGRNCAKGVFEDVKLRILNADTQCVQENASCGISEEFIIPDMLCVADGTNPN